MPQKDLVEVLFYLNAKGKKKVHKIGLSSFLIYIPYFISNGGKEGEEEKK